MKNVFRVFGKMTMTMMFIVLVGLTSCEKEDVFDGKKPTEQVLGGGDEVGNPEDFYPYTDKVIVESVCELFGSSINRFDIITTDTYWDGNQNIYTEISREGVYFYKNKISKVDTLSIEDMIMYEIDRNNKDTYVMVDIYLVFFKDGKRVTKYLESKEVTNISGLTIKKSKADNLL